MNFLFHLHLSGDDPDILTGNLMGDFVKGRVGNDYPPGVREGIVLHRRIDSFAQNDLLFRQSKRRIDQSYGLWRGVLIDLYYDHFLAAEWHNWSDIPFYTYLKRARIMVEGNRRYLSDSLRELVPVIFNELLPSYREVDGIGRALERMSRRVQRINPLAGGERELERNYKALREDFYGFLPLSLKFAQEFITRQNNEEKLHNLL